MRVGRRDVLRLAGAAGLGLLGTAGSAAALVQADVVPGRNRRWDDLDGLVPDNSPTHARGPVEWLEFYGLHKAARTALTDAADNGMRARQATDAVRRLLFRAKLI